METKKINLIERLSKGKYDEVLEAIEYRHYSPEIPQGRIWEIRGLAHYGLVDIASSMHALEMANTMVPLSLIAQISLASCYLHQKFPLSAETIYLHLMIQPQTYNSQTICTGVAEGLTRLDLRPEALKVCRRGLLRFPNSHRLNFLCGSNLRQQNESPYITRDYFHRALRQNPQSIHYAIEYAKDCLAAEDTEEAINTLRPIDPANVHCVAALQRLRLVYEQINDEVMTESCDDQLRAIYYKRQSKYG